MAKVRPFNLSATRWVLLFIVVGAALWLTGSSPAFAQGCSMCQTAASAQSEQAGRAWNHGVVLLLLPPVAIMSTILFCAFRLKDGGSNVDVNVADRDSTLGAVTQREEPGGPLVQARVSNRY